MKKGQKKRVWTKEQKLEIIGKHLNEHISVQTLEREYKGGIIGSSCKAVEIKEMIP